MTRELTLGSGLYAILDPSAVEAGELYVLAAQLLDAGVRVLQLRDKSSPGREVFTRACVLASLCREAGAQLIINDRVDIALAADAHGVHVGPQDLPVAYVRALAPDLLIGASTSNAKDARALVRAGADYVGVGAVYEARAQKPDASAPKGTHIIAEVRKAVDVPLVGIGGITATNAAEVIAAGADGVAVIRALNGPQGSAEAVRALLDALAPEV